MKRFQWISLAVAAAMGLAGCSQSQSAATNTATTAVTAAGQTQITASSAPAGTTAAKTAQTTADVPEQFTDRDYETDYDESAAVQIRLNGSRAEADADSVQIDGSTVTITDEGT